MIQWVQTYTDHNSSLSNKTIKDVPSLCCLVWVREIGSTVLLSVSRPFGRIQGQIEADIFYLTSFEWWPKSNFLIHFDSSKTIMFWCIELNIPFFNFCQQSERLYISPHSFSSWNLIASICIYINFINSSCVGFFRAKPGANTAQAACPCFFIINQKLSETATQKI